MRKLKRSLTKMKRSYLDVTPESEKAQINSKKYTAGRIRLTGNISQTSGIAVLPDDA
jgi:propanediol dehydratase small subunit